ncbi:2'-5' RNA ligase family protein [Streptomyces qinglanensis]|uniref:2'-5' RNA ligase n=1 Tax=Streptomyces qinglanensis TaxID=943816 RepID=A0A1H9VC58_9ACTN|nr:2'-5' RNA ligase family protein [Streptomyces qinglanensis]SES18817.1 2'-5' RNA ligase [Streptomyces qinglanensis]
MGAGATVTLGVSLAVPEPYGTLLQAQRASFGDAAAHGIPTHITLLPPTEVPASARPEIEAHLAAVALAGRAFPVRLSGTGTFRPLSPVVFVQVVEGATACSRLQEQVRDPQGPLDRVLHFPYHPHVTVAHGIPEPAMDRAHRELADFECAWTAAGFALYEQGADQVWRLKREFPFAQHPSAGPGPAAGPGHPQGPGVEAAPAFEVTLPSGTCRPPYQRRSAARPPATL